MKKNNWRRFLGFMLALVLIFTSVPLRGLAETVAERELQPDIVLDGGKTVNSSESKISVEQEENTDDRYSGSVVKTNFYAIYNESGECMFCS